MSSRAPPLAERRAALIAPAGLCSKFRRLPGSALRQIDLHDGLVGGRYIAGEDQKQREAHWGVELIELIGNVRHNHCVVHILKFCAPPHPPKPIYNQGLT